MFDLISISIYFCLPKTILFFFLILRDNLLTSNQFLRFSSSLSTANRCSYKFRPELNHFVSSTKITHFNKSLTSQMSLIYRINSFGPITDPRGTPQVIVLNPDTTSLICTHCFLFCINFAAKSRLYLLSHTSPFFK